MPEHSTAQLPTTQSPSEQGRIDTLMAAVSGVSVRTKILGIVLILTALLGLSVTLQVRSVMSETLLAEVDNRGHSVVSDLAARSVEPLVNGDQRALQTLLTETVSNHPDTRYAFVVDNRGQVVAHTFPGETPASILALLALPDLRAEQHIHYENYEGNIHDFSMPISDVPLVHGAVQEEHFYGAVRLGLAETRLQDIINNVTRRLLLTTFAVAIVGILAAIFLTWLLTRPILDLVTTTNRIRRGELTARAPHWSDDEIGELADAFNQMVCELQVSQETVVAKEAARTHLLSRLIDAQEDERKRIARDLHDDVGQALTSTLLQIKLLQQQCAQQGAVANALTELRGVVDQTLTTVRLLSRQLRPSVLDDLGLAVALERYSHEFASRYPAITVDLHCDLGERLPPSIEISLYRIIQEAMTNSARHSDASTISVLVIVREGRVQVIVEDDGQGFSVDDTLRSKSSVGLHSMTERAELLDGRIQLESNREGTTVFVEVPVAD